MAYRLYMMEEDRARKVRPILRWVKENAPRKREKEEAAGLLRAIEGIKGHRQVSLSKGQAELLTFIYQEFPETTFKPQQLKLGLAEDRVIDKIPKGKYKGPKSQLDPEKDKPKGRAFEKSTLRTTFSKEEQEQRRSIGLSPFPQSVPTDAEGRPLTKGIAETRQRMEERERSFGKQKEEVRETPDG